ncbi:MAG: AI-2E family transporter [Oscillospiraceae bacterium]|nr:AI-2E family transporter [Oscillospiraceae bacterium]
MKKFNSHSKYIKGGITAFAVIAAGILFYFGLDYIKDLLGVIGGLLNVLAPFIWGLAIAYLLWPITKFLEKCVCVPLVGLLYKRHPRMKGNPRLARGLAVLLSVIVLLLILTALFYLLVPQLYDSVKTIVINGPDYINSAYDSLARLLDDYPEFEATATRVFGDITTAISKWMSNKVLPGMENAIGSITTGLLSALKTLYNFVIGVVVAIYILANKENFLAHSKKLIYSIFSRSHAAKLSRVLSFMDRTFMGFLVGNTVDALIIGVTCYIFCLIFRMPYALLIAAIVGITNFIPFFGPFIGGIPSGLLILLVDPWKCLIFAIFIIILQQIDGTYIKPKILGGSFGIHGFWVMFAIIFFGGIFGFWGMLLGVPFFVIAYEGITRLVDQALERKELSRDAADYRDLDYIDPDTGEMIRSRKEEPQKADEAADKNAENT